MSEQGSAGNVIAALCSFFIPGLGQLIQGRILAAILFFAIITIGYGFGGTVGIFLLYIPLVITFLIHIYCIYNAATFKPS